MSQLAWLGVKTKRQRGCARSHLRTSSLLWVERLSRIAMICWPLAGGSVSSICSRKRIRSKRLRVCEVIACVSPECTRSAANRFIVPLRVYS